MMDVDRMRQLYTKTGSCRKVAEIMGISRNTVTKYLKKTEDYQNGIIIEIIPENRNIARTRPVCNEKILTRIHSFLEENQDKPKKQRLNARAIWRILQNDGISVSYTTVQREVRAWKQGNVSRDVCIVQELIDGERAECDWGDVTLSIKEKASIYGLIAIVLNSSLYRFGRVYPTKSQNNLFYALIEFFHEIGGVPKNIFFDNMTSVVTYSQNKVFNERFMQFSAHYGFCTNACNKASPQEKGTVEKSVSVVRLAAFADCNSFSTLEEANEHLKEALFRINNSPAYRRDVVPSVGLEQERELLLPLPSFDFSLYDLKYRKINRYSTVTFERNRYSVPESCKAKILALKVYSDLIEILEGETLIASHLRLFGRDECSLQIEHYLSTLRNKPGSLKHCKVLRTADPCLRTLFTDHYVKEPKEFIRILSLIKEYSQQTVVYAIKELFDQGIIPEYETLRLLLDYQPTPIIEPFCYALDIDIPEPDLTVYDAIALEEINNG